MSPSVPIPAQSSEEILGRIRTSILEKTPVRVIYDGGTRLVCPQMMGRSRDGRVRILCLQIGGESGSGLVSSDEHGNWRCLALEKLVSVMPAAAAWRSAGSSLRRPKCIDETELEVTDQPEREPQNGQ